ncbi:hypothetical protein Taro_031444 [Colocasia esculenta]|uniref:Uncharacterized protein n=1 Tax=Colocasia esculenta TaxID=4460 RepID=A0A843W6F4_COLES|nr:hypothetical protein [Colocasia esculenta]
MNYQETDVKEISSGDRGQRARKALSTMGASVFRFSGYPGEATTSRVSCLQGRCDFPVKFRHKDLPRLMLEALDCGGLGFLKSCHRPIGQHPSDPRICNTQKKLQAVMRNCSASIIMLWVSQSKLNHEPVGILLKTGKPINMDK